MRSGPDFKTTVGVLLIVAGALVLILGKLRIPFGRLPGDIVIERENSRFLR